MWQYNSKVRTRILGYSLFDGYRNENGYTAIMTPDTPAGPGLFHERHWSLPSAEFVTPAIAQPEGSIVITPHRASVWTR